MISNQIIQDTIDGLKEITKIDFCILDTEAKLMASTFEEAGKYEHGNDQQRLHSTPSFQPALYHILL